MLSGENHQSCCGFFYDRRTNDFVPVVQSTAIVDGSASLLDVSAALLTINAGTGVGAADALDIDVATLDVDNTTSGGVWLAQTTSDTLTTNNITQSASNFLTVTSQGAVTVSGTSVLLNGVAGSALSDISITSNGLLDVQSHRLQQ